jgi:CubicO group peptidase (beta-lactamase class C family)
VIGEAQARFEAVFGGPSGLAAHMAAAGAPGLSLTAFAGGETLLAAAYGAAGPADHRLTPELRLQAASLSKPVAAALALGLVDEGRVDLDEPLTDLLPAWPGQGDPRARGVTLRRLLSHSAGLTVDGFAGYADTQLPTLVQSLAGAPPANNPPVEIEAAPGAGWRYSGGGYLLVQGLIERLLGEPFAKAAQDRLLAPLGMDRSVFSAMAPGGEGRDWASGHDGRGERLPAGRRLYPELAAAGLWSTPSDLARFARAIQDAAAGRGGVVSQAAAELMLRPQLEGFSLAFHVQGPPNARRFSHSGSNAGSRCELRAWAGGAEHGAVVMVNGEPAPGFIGGVFEALAASLDWPFA